MEQEVFFMGGGCNCKTRPCAHSDPSAFAMRAAASKKKAKPQADKAAREAAKKAARFTR